MTHTTRLMQLGLIGVLVAGCGAARGQGFTYACRTPSGEYFRGDQIPAQCFNSDVRVLRPDGSLKEIIARPPTPEERAAREAEQRRIAAEKDARRVQYRRDRALLVKYSSVDEIEAARGRALKTWQVISDGALERIHYLERDLKKLKNEEEFYENRDLPEELKRALADNGEKIQAQRRTIKKAQTESGRINQRYDAEAKRFQELLDGGATPAPR